MRVRWTRLAMADLGDARAYVAQGSPSAAERIVGRVEDAVQALARHPFIGRPGRIEGTRELVIPGTPFFAPYWISGDAVEILALVHGARRWP